MGLRVLLCDEHDVVRLGMRSLLDDIEDIDVVGEADNGPDAIRSTCELRPDVVVTDIRPPGIDGIQMVRRLSGRDDPVAHVVVLTDSDDEELLLEVLGAGARGLVYKRESTRDIPEAIRAAAAGDALVAPSMTGLLLDRFAERGAAYRGPSCDLESLTEREREVLSLIAEGRSSAEAAGDLCVSEATVKSHIHHVLRKLGMRNRVEAAIAAHEAGLTQRDREVAA